MRQLYIFRVEGRLASPANMAADLETLKVPLLYIMYICSDELFHTVGFDVARVSRGSRNAGSWVHEKPVGCWAVPLLANGFPPCWRCPPYESPAGLVGTADGDYRLPWRENDTRGRISPSLCILTHPSERTPGLLWFPSDRSNPGASPGVANDDQI
jgi:hypothetical protein